MNLTLKAHEECARFIAQSGARFAADFTLGNGFDALFLAKTLPADGKVYAFDVQEAALESSRKLFFENGVPQSKYEFFLKSHADWVDVLGARSKEIACAMLNLGWLPKSDKKTITDPVSTLACMGALLKVFKEAGRPAFLSALCYRGHVGGLEEFEAVRGFLNAGGASLAEFCGDAKNSPVLFCARF